MYRFDIENIYNRMRVGSVMAASLDQAMRFIAAIPAVRIALYCKIG